MMGARLAVTTTVSTPSLESNGFRTFGPDDEDIPEWAARQMGAHCFVDGKHPFPDDDADGVTDREQGSEPPRAGKGSGTDSWVAFAREKGQDDIDTSWKRDDIVSALVDRAVIDAS